MNLMRKKNLLTKDKEKDFKTSFYRTCFFLIIFLSFIYLLELINVRIYLKHVESERIIAVYCSYMI